MALIVTYDMSVSLRAASPTVRAVPGMTDEEVTAFLDEPGHLVRIGTTDDDGMPLVVPAWFVRDGERLLVTPRERSAWFGHLRRDPRACFTIDEEVGSFRKVVARGAVDLVHDLGEDDAWRETYRRIALRYVPEVWADAYLRDTWNEPRALIGLHLGSARVTTWRMPVAGEDPLAVWAPRYYHRS
jgi:nitroimidazol reductase NimA-like FMN-containing flavoprotein (pyridoxamine 5'-phosphate oxidase superfamily)